MLGNECKDFCRVDFKFNLKPHPVRLENILNYYVRKLNLW